jgi:putative oxidoreductase
MRRLAIGLQVLLGLGFLASGVPKLAGAQEAMRDHLGIALWFWILTALVELVGAAGMLAGIRFPRLVVPAGLWIAALMVGALGAHFRVGDSVANMVPPAVYLILALAVIVLRSGEYELGKRAPKRGANARSG